MAVGGFTTNDATAPTQGTYSTLRQAPCSTGGSSSTRSCSSLTTHVQPTAGGNGYSDETHAAVAWAGGVIELRNQPTCTVAPTITYASGTGVTFNPTAPLDGSPTAAQGQADGTPAMLVTNNGPGTCSISIKRASAAPAGVEDQWNTVNTPPPSGTNDVTLTYQVVCANVAQGSTCSIYMWSRVTASGSTPPGTYTNTYNIQEA